MKTRHFRKFAAALLDTYGEELLDHMLLQQQVRDIPAIAGRGLGGPKQHLAA